MRQPHILRMTSPESFTMHKAQLLNILKSERAPLLRGGAFQKLESSFSLTRGTFMVIMCPLSTLKMTAVHYA
jgi:hypothetical protein